MLLLLLLLLWKGTLLLLLLLLLRGEWKSGCGCHGDMLDGVLLPRLLKEVLKKAQLSRVEGHCALRRCRCLLWCGGLWGG